MDTLWRRVFLLTLLGLYLGGQGVLGALTTASVSVNTLAIAEITDFSVSPAFTSQNQIIDFKVTVANTGNILFNATPFIDIFDSSNTSISNITFTPLSILVGNDATFIAGWNTNGHPLGDYKGVVVLDYENKTTPSEEAYFKIQAVAPPPSGGGGGDDSPPSSPPQGEIIPPEELLPELPPLLPPEEQKLGEGRIRFVKYPVIAEVRPGETATADILFSNIGETDITPLDIDVTGVPDEWIEVRSGNKGIKAGAVEVINMGFSVPAGAFPGNYRVTARLNSGESEALTFFILRVRPYPAELERPSITRRVIVDAEKGVSQISLRVENAGRFIDRLDIIEDIPKDIASHVNQVDFGVPPTQIIEADPVFRWSLENMDFFETRTASYEVPRVLDEYTPYVNWPLRQVNIFYDIKPPSEELEITKVEAPTLYPGDKAQMNITISNLGPTPLDAHLTVDLPSGWEGEELDLNLSLAPSSTREVSLSVQPPLEASLGVYTATLRLGYQEKTISKDVSLFVREPISDAFPWTAALIGAALVVSLGAALYYGRKRLRRRRKVYREDMVSTVHRLQEEIMKGKTEDD